jgi:hypothetical protein
MGLAATALAAALLLGAAGANAAPPQRSSEGPWAKGRLLIVTKPGLSATEVGKIAGAEGGKATRLGQSNIYEIDLPPQASETAARARLRGNPHIETVELDQLVTHASTNDPYYGSAWHLERIRSSDAWTRSTGQGVKIAILDTGVDGAHPDLKDRMIPGYNFYDNNTDTRDVHGHGTGVAGAAAATLNNGTGVASVAGQAWIMPVRIADANAWAYWSTVAKGVTWAADQGARVANISYVGVAGSSTVRSAADYMKSKGGLVVVAAVNNNKDEQISPTTSMIPVSATDTYDQKASFSSWGDFVAMSAPGVDIWTTVRGGSYQRWKGTSLASPVTAAVVAQMMAVNPSLPALEIEKLLYANAVDLGAAGRDPVFGHGRVDAAASVFAAAGAKSTVDTQAPTASIGSPSASSTVSGLVSVSVSASDNVGVARVDLLVNGSRVASDSSAPFSFSWDSTTVANGMAELKAVAVDAAGNTGTSAAVSVNVSNSTTTTSTVADVTAPTVAIGSPTEGSTVPSGTVKVQVKASDNSGLSGLSMELYIGTSRVASSLGSGTIDYGWNTRRLKSGTYTLKAVAKDAAGNVSSHSISVKR